MTLTPPATFSIWEFLVWFKSHENELHVQVTNPSTKQPELVPVSKLGPAAWSFWGQRLFMDPGAPVKTVEAWGERRPNTACAECMFGTGDEGFVVVGFRCAYHQGLAK